MDGSGTGCQKKVLVWVGMDLSLYLVREGSDMDKGDFYRRISRKKNGLPWLGDEAVTAAQGN